MSFLIALALALDQRIELQALVVLGMTIFAKWRLPGTRFDSHRALLVALVAGTYLALNAAVALTNPAGLADNWPAAPARIMIFFLLLMCLATVTSAPKLDAEAMFRVLEWLLLLKLTIAGGELGLFLLTGEWRERPLFNVILSTDSLLGVRLTSSYDILFCLLTLSRRRVWLRAAMLVTVLLLTETRAVLLLSALFLGWRALAGNLTALAVAVVLALGIGLGAQWLQQSGNVDGNPGGTRLTQLAGSSVSDKLEQVDAVKDLLLSPYLITGRGLGMVVPNLVRDEARPYSYEAQTVVLLWQGGVLFFAVYVGVMLAYGGRAGLASTSIVLGLGLLNPMLFAFASAFLLLAMDKIGQSKSAEP